MRHRRHGLELSVGVHRPLSRQGQGLATAGAGNTRTAPPSVEGRHEDGVHSHLLAREFASAGSTADKAGPGSAQMAHRCSGSCAASDPGTTQVVEESQPQLRRQLAPGPCTGLFESEASHEAGKRQPLRLARARWQPGSGGKGGKVRSRASGELLRQQFRGKVQKRKCGAPFRRGARSNGTVQRGDASRGHRVSGGPSVRSAFCCYA
mmetsp:Transcript_53372/g.114714  ORF Transcript_53372/g.114714 Transcript_53372/m.114714 type:complete len:207 (+) Transcript_53372:616-1236(+)